MTESKTWVCLNCEHTIEWPYEALAAKGNPVCEKCGDDMKVQEEISCRKCGKIISRELAFHLDDELCQTCFDERNSQPKTYICPYCKEKQTKIIEWLSASIGEIFDVESGQYEEQEKVIIGEHETYTCPRCKEELSYDFVHKNTNLR